jgi:thioredoxin-dependent peroxiredoxin
MRTFDGGLGAVLTAAGFVVAALAVGILSKGGAIMTKAAGNTMYPEVGEKAPSFSAAASTGGTVKLDDFKGKVLVLYFYPKDDTPGCTTEACGFRDSYQQYTDAGIAVVGVSPDAVASHEKFIGKYNLPFTLLADEDHRICEAYGVWQEKTSGDRKYMSVARTTFVIDKDGRVAHIFEGVKPAGHEGEVLEWIEQKL